MKRLIVVCAPLLLWASSVSAKGIAGAIKGQLVSDTSGACDVGYSSYCPSGDCECARITGDVSGSGIGRGSVNLLMTIDHGAQVSPAGAPTCYPIFASAQITTPHDQEIMNMVGAICAPASGQTAKVTGGFGIKSSTVGWWGGWGSVSGRISPSTGVAVVRYLGFAYPVGGTR